MTGAPSTSLLAIIALTRSGALERAKRLFREAGLDSVVDDPATLSVRGRLLKDEARRTRGAGRAALWREAGDAYARAAELSGATYHLINAATLALLAGDRDKAADRARQVLARLDAGDTGPETPYYLAATRAESLLLLGRADEAQAALTQAVRLAPDAWEDHASTLRQFVLILDELKMDSAWLTALQPPRSLHFAGPLALVEDAGLRARIDAFLADERIGFAYGALAGGADLIVAEAVLARGAELHLVLPAPAAVFRSDSAAPLGGDWPVRFDAVLERAATVRVVDAHVTTTTMLHVRLAAEVAVGKAVMNAAAIASEPIQLLLTRTDAGAGATVEIGEHWRRSGHRQATLNVAGPSDAATPVKSLPERPEDGALAAMLAVAFDRPETSATSANPGRTLHRIGAALGEAGPPITAPVVSGDTLHIAFADPADAARIASLICSSVPDGEIRIAGHYGVARLIENPFGAERVLIGPAAAQAANMLASIPAGAIHLSETFAAALNGWSGPAVGETNYVGDLARGDESTAIYAFTPTAP